MSYLRPALVLLVLFTALTGLAYPLAMTGIGQALFPGAANGSLVRNASGTIVGSDLIGQNFTGAGYLHPRPSATSGPDPADPSKTTDLPYNAAASTGSNLGPTSQKLSDRLKAGEEALRAEGITGPIPADAITTSGSGLDPHTSPAYALAQAPRIAQARNRPAADIVRLIEANTESRSFGLIGEPRVNVLRVNRALDANAS
jgi:K+-transporting ATPase ATPase C chain